MGRWTDLAQWRGPTVNQGGKMSEVRGVVVHIAQGSYEGTIAWQRNPDADVSSHFVVAKDGRCAQLVDTAVAAWTQAAGNGHWLSIENEGFSGMPLTAAQVAVNAAILAKAHQTYGAGTVPLQLATTPSERGLGHHSMGGAGWGNHPNCPGAPIRQQKAAILAAAINIVNGVDVNELQDQRLEAAVALVDALAKMQPTVITTWAQNPAGVQSMPIVVAVNELKAQLTAVAAAVEALAGPGDLVLTSSDRAAIVAELTAAILPQIEAAAERAMRKVALDAATPDAV